MIANGYWPPKFYIPTKIIWTRPKINPLNCMILMFQTTKDLPLVIQQSSALIMINLKVCAIYSKFRRRDIAVQKNSQKLCAKSGNSACKGTSCSRVSPYHPQVVN